MVMPGVASAAVVPAHVDTTSVSGSWVRVRSSTEFTDQVRHAFSRGKLVVAEFYAPWCPVCASVEEPLNELLPQLSDRYEAIRVNVDEVRDLVRREGIERIPTVLVYREGAGRQMQATVTPARVPQLAKALHDVAARPALRPGSEYVLSPITGELHEGTLTADTAVTAAFTAGGEGEPLPPSKPAPVTAPYTVQDPQFRAEFDTFVSKHGADYAYGMSVDQFNQM